MSGRQDDFSKIVDALSGELGELAVRVESDLTALQHIVEVDVKTQLTALDQDLRSEVRSQLGELNGRIKKDMEPLPNETANKVAGVEDKVDTISNRVKIELEELTTGFTKSLTAMPEDLEKVQKDVDEALAASDLDTMLMNAAVKVG